MGGPGAQEGQRSLKLALEHLPFSLCPQDYRTPGISLFSEEGLKGQQVMLTGDLKDSQGLERPLQVASATVSAGL